MCNDRAKRRAFNLAWDMAQLNFDNALLGVSEAERRGHKQRARAKFMELLSGAKKMPATKKPNAEVRGDAPPYGAASLSTAVLCGAVDIRRKT